MNNALRKLGAKAVGAPFVLTLSLLLVPPGQAAQVPDPQARTLSARLFPVLAAMDDRVPGAPNAEGSGLARMLADRRQRMLQCREAPACLFAAAAWTPQERETLANAITLAFQTEPHQATPLSDDGVKAEVLRELNGLNHILDVYGLGKAPEYPEIDGPGDALGTPQFARNSTNAVALAEAAGRHPAANLDLSLDLAIALLDVNDRDTASAFEPLDQRYNLSALERARSLDWSKYNYTAIIVPGEGPDDLATALSSTGKLRVRLAAERFFDGVAPYIIVTGGAVHPRGTTHVEAMEMRQALIERYGVPADSIVIEPYARHTTTNLRNASRRLLALGAPFDRDALIVSDPVQSQYIQSDEFANRNQRELGYQPGTIEGRLSPTELLFRPARASARIDAYDPLDP